MLNILIYNYFVIIKESKKEQKAADRKKAAARRAEEVAKRFGKSGKHVQPSEIAMAQGVSTQITFMCG